MMEMAKLMRFAALLVVITLMLPMTALAKAIHQQQVGAAQLSQYLPMLKGKRVGLVVNQTSMVGQQHLVDLLLSQSVTINKIFAPEHGFRGDRGAGEVIKSGVDVKTGIPIQSIYGKHKRPNPETLADLDVIVFDIQDVGARFYTYISSMHYMMQAAAESDLEFIVLDRPNPNIQYVDGPILEPEFRSFVGMHPIPVLHGMTVAELAQMIVGEGWLTIHAANSKQHTLKKLTVIPVKNYQRQDTYSLPVAPSPNLPNDLAIALYPSLCFFEATPISIGRGTEFPFQVIGYQHSALAKLDLPLGDFRFTPKKRPKAAPYPKLEGQVLAGQDLTQSDIKGLSLAPFIHWHQTFQYLSVDFFQRPTFMDKLAGTDKLRLAITQGQSEQQIRQRWASAIGGI